MPVTPRPKSVEQFIAEAGTTAAPIEEQTAPASDPIIHSVQLRLPAELLSEIDAAVRKRRPAPSRHQWILEAIYEKLTGRTGSW